VNHSACSFDGATTHDGDTSDGCVGIDDDDATDGDATEMVYN